MFFSQNKLNVSFKFATTMKASWNVQWLWLNMTKIFTILEQIVADFVSITSITPESRTYGDFYA